MKRALLLLAILLFSIRGIAQHPLVGTWRLISVKGINADGSPFLLDTTQVTETKIFTSAHYMLIAEDVRGDSSVFNRCYAGTVRFEGNKFVETPFQASLPIFDGVKTDFTWKVKGDVFTQSGTIVRPDGKKVVLEALQFRRVKEAKSFPKNPALGAWSLKSSTTTDFDGSKHEFNNTSGAMFQLITPTHWMRISHQNGKFDEAIGGTYEIVNGKTIIHITEGSAKVKGSLELTDRVEGAHLIIKGKLTTEQGKIMTWEEVFERAQPHH